MSGARAVDRPVRVTGLLLAAGTARRFGGQKLLAALPDGRAVAAAALEGLMAGADRVLAVVRRDDDALAAVLRGRGAVLVVAERAEEGMGASLAAGARAARGDALLAALADMPWVEAESVRAVAQALRDGARAAVPVHGGRRGHPVGFCAALGPSLERLGGDVGAREVLRAQGPDVVEIPVADAGVLRDVDEPADLGARAHPAGRGPRSPS